MKMRQPITIAAATLLTVAAAVTLVLVATGEGPPPIDTSKLTEEEKAAIPKTAEADAAAYLADFQAKKRDPRSLPIARPVVDGSRPDPKTAIEIADLIVHGIVGDAKFETIAGGAEPYTITTVRVLDVYKGIIDESSKAITLVQAAGPVRIYPDREAFQISDGDDLLSVGDEVILLLDQRMDGRGYMPQYSTGVYFVRDGLVYAGTGNPFPELVNGKTIAEVVAMAKSLFPEATAASQ